MDEQRSSLAIDLGNTRIKLYDGTLLYAERYEDADWNIVASVASSYSTIAYSSVQGEYEQKLCSVLDNRCENVSRYVRELPHFNPNYSTVGIDRMMGLMAALESTDDVITVDCGTAITINAAAGGAFIGGVMMPGITTQARSLHDCTFGLPFVDITSTILSPEVIGESTESNIVIGIVRGVVGAIERHLHDITMQHFTVLPSIVLTGGDAGLVKPLLNTYHNVQHKEYLVLDGILRVISTFIRN